MSVPMPGSAAELLAELDALGVQLGTEGEHLRFRPRERVTTDLADRMKAHKVELLAAVRKRKALDRRIAEQVARLVRYRTRDGRDILVNPDYLEELDRLGLL